MKNLVRIYEDVQIVNRAFHKRLSNIKMEDANVNALVILNCFADSVTFSINKEMLEDIELLLLHTCLTGSDALNDLLAQGNVPGNRTDW